MISIIIPTHNRALTLVKTIDSICQLRDLEDVEVIVVDNGSSDNTQEVCKKYKDSGQFIFHYIFDKEPGLLTGRHAGALAASGDILCFLDDDVELSPGWLNGVKDAFNNKTVQLATGPSLPRYEVPPPDWINYFKMKAYSGEALTSLSLLDLGNSEIEIDPLFVFGLNFCIRKEAIFALGGFHPDYMPAKYEIFQGDGETGLTLKARDQKYKSVYHPEIKLWHLISKERLTTSYFEKRYYFQGFCNSFTLLRDQNGIQQPAETIFSTVISILRSIKSIPGKIAYRLSTPAEIRSMKTTFNKREKEGFNFHQEVFRKNKKVRAWVLKKDYWDYKLPL
jgi:glucosyl-dolichyl phosphate glucuronosyltransferase